MVQGPWPPEGASPELPCPLMGGSCAPTPAGQSSGASAQVPPPPPGWQRQRLWRGGVCTSWQHDSPPPPGREAAWRPRGLCGAVSPALLSLPCAPPSRLGPGRTWGPSAQARGPGPGRPRQAPPAPRQGPTAGRQPGARAQGRRAWWGPSTASSASSRPPLGGVSQGPRGSAGSVWGAGLSRCRSGALCPPRPSPDLSLFLKGVSLTELKCAH